MTNPTPEAPKEPTTEDKKPLSLVYNCYVKGMPPNPHQDWQSYFAHCAATGTISGLRFEAIQPSPSINDTTLPETTMTNPTPRSPAAQAVLDATTAVGLGSFVSRAAAAAALRAAAADQLKWKYPLSPQYTEWDAGHDAGIQRMTNKILAIAAELDGTNTTESPH